MHVFFLSIESMLLVEKGNGNQDIQGGQYIIYGLSSCFIYIYILHILSNRTLCYVMTTCKILQAYIHADKVSLNSPGLSFYPDTWLTKVIDDTLCSVYDNVIFINETRTLALWHECHHWMISRQYLRQIGLFLVVPWVTENSVNWRWEKSIRGIVHKKS